MWVVSGESGIEKRVQLIISADSSTLPPLINPADKRELDKRDKVMFQPNSLCDENIMKRWIKED